MGIIGYYHRTEGQTKKYLLTTLTSYLTDFNSQLYTMNSQI